MKNQSEGVTEDLKGRGYYARRKQKAMLLVKNLDENAKISRLDHSVKMKKSAAKFIQTQISYSGAES